LKKRDFIKGLALSAMTQPFNLRAMESFVGEHAHLSAQTLAGDEAFWETIRKGYRLKEDYINLENGYYCFQPEAVLEKFIGHVREVNFQGSYYMRTVQWDNKKKAAEKLAEIAGCTSEELVITRNTTESLDMVIGGQDWKTGDEAVMAEQDYGAMLDMFKLVAKRYGVVNKIVSVPNHPKNDEEVVQLYASAITPRTKLLMVGHMINITGHILPIRKICDMANAKGVKVMVDGAHAFAHFRYSIPDLGCDYYGASLHKWLSVPLGAGILYVRKDSVDSTWPLLADGERKPGDIGRLNHIGTHPVHTDLTIADAVDFYRMIGPERKEERLRFLQQYWTSRVRNIPGVIVNTPADPARSCGIANVGVTRLKPSELAEVLLKKYRIWTVAIDYANVKGCRICPNVYTTPAELDVLVKALTELSVG